MLIRKLYGVYRERILQWKQNLGSFCIAPSYSINHQKKSSLTLHHEYLKYEKKTLTHSAGLPWKVTLLSKIYMIRWTFFLKIILICILVILVPATLVSDHITYQTKLALKSIKLLVTHAKEMRKILTSCIDSFNSRCLLNCVVLLAIWSYVN